MPDSQLLSVHCSRLGLPLRSCGEKFERVARAICCGLVSKAARWTGCKNEYETLIGRQTVILNRQSVLNGDRLPGHAVCLRRVGTDTAVVMYDCVRIQPSWLPEAAQHVISRIQSELES